MTRLAARGAALATAVLAVGGLVACSDSERAAPKVETPVAAAKAPIPAAPAASAPTLKPPGSEVIDATLASVQAFNAKAVDELATVTREEQRIRQASAAAQSAARSGEGARIAGARRTAEAASGALATARSALTGAAAAQSTGLQAALMQCAAPEISAYEGCVALAAEQVLFNQTIAQLEARYAMADVVWAQERPRLEEAAASVALSGLR